MKVLLFLVLILKDYLGTILNILLLLLILFTVALISFLLLDLRLFDNVLLLTLLLLLGWTTVLNWQSVGQFFNVAISTSSAILIRWVYFIAFNLVVLNLLVCLVIVLVNINLR